MITQNRIKTILTLAAVAMALVFTAAPANAVTLSTSATAPVVDGFDIASFGTSTGQDKWWAQAAGAYGNPSKTVGQTFTTGGSAVMLTAFTFQIREATEPTKTYTIRVGTVSDTTFTEIYSEGATQSVANAADAYWTWTLDSPVLLAANTVYGVDVGLLSSTSEWGTGIPYVYYTADVYADGTRFRSGTAGFGVGDDTMTHMSGDRVFHIDMLNADPNAPTVDAGVDKVTWSDQPVTLAPTVTNNDTLDPPRDLTHHWTANPDTGVEFSDPNVEAPTVTITKAGGDAVTVTLTLAVNLQGRTEEPDVEDTMTIDVYDDSCLAAIGVGQAEIDPGDFDEDCDTDFEDYAILAEKWLVNYELSAPVPKP